VGEISSNATPYPSDGHIKTAKRTLRCLKTTGKHMLRLGGSGPNEMFGFIDASHITSGKSMSCLGRHFTPMEQVYKEIDLHDAVLAAQRRTRIKLAKHNPTK
jgi:hypothetical protein